MRMKFKNRAKKIMAETLLAGLLAASVVLLPTGQGEENLRGEILAESEQPGNDNGDEVMPCGDWEEDNFDKNNQ